MEIRDPKMPHGITQISINFLKRNYKKIGEIVAVKIAQNVELDLKTYVVGTMGTLVTDGFAVGYSGEGPTGLRTALRAFEMKIDKKPNEIGLKDGEGYVWYVDKPSIKMSLKLKLKVRRINGN